MKRGIIECILYFFMCRNSFYGINPVAPAMCGIMLADKKSSKLSALGLYVGSILCYVPPVTLTRVADVVKYLFICITIMTVHHLFQIKNIQLGYRGMSYLCGGITLGMGIVGNGFIYAENIVLSVCEGIFVIVGINVLYKGVRVVVSYKQGQGLSVEQFVSVCLIGALFINGLYDPWPETMSVKVPALIVVLGFLPKILSELIKRRNEQNVYMHSDVKEAVSVKLGEFEKALSKIGDNISHIGIAGLRPEVLLNRSLIADQMKEMANLLAELEREVNGTHRLRLAEEKDLLEAFTLIGLKIKKIGVMETNDGRMKVTVKARSSKGEYISLKEMAEVISDTFKQKYVADNDCYFVPKEYKELIFVQDVRFNTLSGIARRCRDGEHISGDNYSIINLPTGKVMMTIADGMGSGDSAYTESELVIEMIEELAAVGFSEGVALRYINSAMIFSKDDESFSTADISVINLNNGMCECIKCGGVTTFIKNRRGVRIVDIDTMPIGILPDARPESRLYKLSDGDMVIMISDGILDSVNDPKPQECIKRFIMEDETDNPQEMADDILALAESGTKGYAIDDMTVLALGIWQKI